MLPISKLFSGLFSTREPVVTLVQTALEPVHEEDATQGCEFLDDLSPLDDQPDSETN